MSGGDSRTYCLRVLAVKTDDQQVYEEESGDDEPSEFFVFRRSRFRKLFNFDYERVVREVASNKDFSIRMIQPNYGESCRRLGLYFTPGGCTHFRPERRLNLLHLCFDAENILPPSTEENSEGERMESYQHRKQTIAKLFQFLRETHEFDILHQSVPEKPESSSLKATLRPYQLRAVRWLLHRELAQETLPHNYLAVTCSELPGVEFFLNPDYLQVTENVPDDIPLPTGGILADEMGLGKTVEMLALFLLNKRSLPNLTSADDKSPQFDPPARNSEVEISCLCGSESKRNLIKCSRCGTFQHTRCTRKYASQQDEESSYLCPKCWEEEPITKSNTTIIVSPATIRQQWGSEIAKHTENVRVFTYDGVVTTGWINPIELSRFDIVLTDYNVLKKEIDFSMDRDTQLTLRRKRKYIRKSTPLNMIEWWRVLLDEAQMVESGVTKCAQMVKELAAIHRWAVTGTPIQKSIDDIRGLLEFIGVAPFSKHHIWQSLSAAFQAGNRKPLMDVLSKVMWRTCKATVLEELGIPPQTEKVHYLVMSDVQRLFYRGQHSSSSWAFENIIRKYPASLSLSQLDPHSLKTILEPLRKLRQDCTVPVIFKKMEQSQVKKCLTPKELTEHLISKNELESKNHLRCMVSAINGQAALHIIRQEYSKATELYTSVLALAEKYNEIISVDTLLQIHALHNLVEIYSMAPSNTTDLNAEKALDYKSRCDKLEWKYLSIYNEQFLKAQTNFNQAQNAYLETATKLPKNKEVCWQSLLATLKMNNLDVRFLDKLNEEYALTEPNMMHNFRMIEGVSFFLIQWIDKIFLMRTEVLKHFQKFKAYVSNIKPQSELTEEGRSIIKTFVTVTFDCHLNELRNNSKKKKEKDKEKRNFCNLCKAKKCLDEYECVIFNKIFDDKRENMEGSWKPTIQESICRTILRFARASNIDDDDFVEANEFLKLLECVKNEYKELVKLWIEIEYTVKAYDEIDMCKLRLQLLEDGADEDDEEEEKANYQLKPAEVEFYLEELANDYLVAETQFQKKLSRLNYIRHLESNEDPGICPICKHEPDAKYSMLQCGHHLCMMCLIGMKEFQRNVLTCAVCRFRQKYEEVYYVTRKPNDPDLEIIEVKGQYSSKVEEIVREILRLKKIESDVKIIIFSHWYAILGVIAHALQTNDITLAFKQNVTQAINLFKQPDSNITCLLLMLSQGSKGLNLTEATHVFLVEPILNPGEEQQAIGRIHRIGQTRPTTVHRFIMKETIEETIHNTVSNDQHGKWADNDLTINNIRSLFSLD